MFLNTEILGHPVNYIKVGLMMATFLLGILLVTQLVFMNPEDLAAEKPKTVSPVNGDY